MYKTHGGSYTPEYRTWEDMRRRCHSPKHRDFPDYGGRGITVCDRWRYSFEHFVADLGVRPSPKHSIEREDVNGHYEPANCRWATTAEQRRNQRRSIRVIYCGETYSLADLCDSLSLGYNLVRSRLVRGWSVERALSTPPLPRLGGRDSRQQKPANADSRTGNTHRKEFLQFAGRDPLLRRLYGKEIRNA